MRPRYLLFITLLALCHQRLGAQALTDEFTPVPQSAAEGTVTGGDGPGTGSSGTAGSQPIPDDPGQEILPVAQPEPAPATGIPVEWEAQRQTRVGDTWTLSGDVTVRYRGCLLGAGKVTSRESTSELEAEGHLQVTGGPEDVFIEATPGDMRLD